jgi:hypothetical protein
MLQPPGGLVAAFIVKRYRGSSMRIFVFLHVLAMFGAVALSGGGQIFLLTVAGRRSVSGIRESFAAEMRLVPYIRILFPLGLVLGLIAMVVHRFDPFAPWLVIAYVLFVAGIVTGAVGVGGWVDRVQEAASTSGDVASPELEAAIAHPRGRYFVALFWAIIAVIIFDMVIKPFS